MTFYNFKDDSLEIIHYYTQLFYKKSDKDILNKIIEIMKTWSSIIKSGNFDIKAQEIFKNAISDSHEFVWFEAGSRLAKLFNYQNEVIQIFDDCLQNKNWHIRFNIVALTKFFPKEYAELILKNCINDKSSKVRQKVTDVILTRQERNFLSILEKRLLVEVNKKVINSIKFVLDNFDKIESDGTIQISK